MDEFKVTNTETGLNNLHTAPQQRPQHSRQGISLRPATYCCAGPWKTSVTPLSQNGIGQKGPLAGDLWLDQVLGRSGLIKPFIFPKHQTAASTAQPLPQPPAQRCRRPRMPGAPAPSHQMKDAQGGCGVSFSGDIQDPPGRGPAQPAVGDPASAGGLD